MNITYQESLSLFACACTQTFYSSLLRLVLIFCSLLCVTHDFHWNHFLLPEIHPLEFSLAQTPVSELLEIFIPLNAIFSSKLERHRKCL